MEQNNNKKLETFDSNAQTAVFSPITNEKSTPPVKMPVREVSEIEENIEKNEDTSSETNAVLLSVVIVLVILFIAALIWGTFVLNKINKKEAQEAMRDTQAYFNFRVQLDTEGKIGLNWSDCH